MVRLTLYEWRDRIPVAWHTEECPDSETAYDRAAELLGRDPTNLLDLSLAHDGSWAEVDDEIEDS